MKYTDIIKVCVLAIALALPQACQKYYPMVAPPMKDTVDDLDEEIGGSMPIFVTMYGAGTMDGTSWDNAMDTDGLRDLMTNHINLSKRKICVAEGTYLTSTAAGEGMILSKDIFLIQGGFPSTNTGTDVSNYDPEKYKTIFSGDVNENSRPDEGDCTLFKLTTGHVAFQGCQFSYGFLSAELSVTLKGQIGAGVYVNGEPTTTSFSVTECVFSNNKSLATNSGVSGGPCALLASGYFKARDTRFLDNAAGSDGRGGAIRVNNDAGCVFLDRCFFSGNTFSGKYGMAVQMSAGYICINNTTLVDNPGDSGCLNGGGSFFISNSTVVGDSEDKSDYAFRCESSGESDTKMVNNVFANEKADGFGININNNKPDVTSIGWNVYQGVKYGDNNDRNTSIFTPALSDLIYNGVLPGRLEGYCWKFDASVLNMTAYATVQNVIDALKTFKPVKSGYQYNNLGEEFLAWVGEAGFMVDCRGESRNPEKLQPGSYDAKLN